MWVKKKQNQSIPVKMENQVAHYISAFTITVSFFFSFFYATHTLRFKTSVFKLEYFISEKKNTKYY